MYIFKQIDMVAGLIWTLQKILLTNVNLINENNKYGSSCKIIFKHNNYLIIK